MKYQSATKTGIVVIGFALFTTCGFAQSQSGQGQRGGERPSATQLITEMDSDNDGKLSESEVKGPLANGFSDVDANSDGYISQEELENAPKPQGGRQRR